MIIESLYMSSLTISVVRLLDTTSVHGHHVKGKKGKGAYSSS